MLVPVSEALFGPLEFWLSYEAQTQSMVAVGSWGLRGGSQLRVQIVPETFDGAFYPIGDLIQSGRSSSPWALDNTDLVMHAEVIDMTLMIPLIPLLEAIIEAESWNEASMRHFYWDNATRTLQFGI